MQRPTDDVLIRDASHQNAVARSRQMQRRKSGPQIDFVRIARRNVWWLLQGLLIGLACGYLHFRNLKPQFRSSAKVQIIESSSKNLPVQDLEGGVSKRQLSDEVLVMKSERILLRGAELANLEAQPEFAGATPEQIAAKLAGSEALVVQPALDSGDTSVFQIQYDCNSPEVSQLVVQGVIDGYADYLQTQYRNVGLETIELIKSARSDVLEKLRELEERFAIFREQSGMIFRDNLATSIHMDNAENLLQQQQELMTERAELSSILSVAKTAMDEGRPDEAVMMGLAMSMRSQQPGDTVEQIQDENRDEEIRRIRDTAQIRMSERMRQEQLLPLKIERQQMIDSVGLDHPALVSIDKRMKVIQETIEQIADYEEQLDAKLAAAWTREGEEGAASGKQKAEERVRERLENAILALRLRLTAIDEETKIVGEAYSKEMAFAKEESAKEMQSAQFVREIGRQQELYDRIMDRLEEVNLMSAGAGLKVFPLDTAKPGYQFAPSFFKSVVMGGFLGLMIVAGMVLLFDWIDGSYRSALDIAEDLGLPVLGHIPLVKNHKKKAAGNNEVLDPTLCTLLNGSGQESEAFRALRTALFFSNQSLDHQVLQVTSATPRDGKSMIAANLAVSVAKAGRRVLLIDADLRRHRVDKIFGMNCKQGLAWALDLVGRLRGGDEINKQIDKVCQQTICDTVVPRLSVLMSGPTPENPAELLSSRAFERLLGALRCKFDMIIIDTPPLLAVSDPSNVVQRADGVLLVVRLHNKVKPNAARAARMLETLNANVLGVVVNGVGSSKAGSYSATGDNEASRNQEVSYKDGFGYSYGANGNGKYVEYYVDDPSSGKRKRRRRSEHALDA